MAIEVCFPGEQHASLALGLGTLGMGTKTDERESRRILDAYVAAGGRLIDTAASYSDWIPGEVRRVEKLLGRWLREHGGRERIYLSTKGCHPDRPFDLETAGHRVRPEVIRDEISVSLDALGTDYIDLWFLHRDDPLYPVEPLVDTLNAEVRAGRIRAFGVSNWTTKRIEKANTYAERSGQAGFVANQVRWSLASAAAKPFPDRSLVAMDEAMLAWHRDSGAIAMPYASLAGGYFTKALGSDEAWRETRLNLYDTPSNRKRLGAVAKIVARKACSPTAVALAYLWHHDFPVAPLVGPSRLGQLEEILEAAGSPLAKADLDTLKGDF